MTRNCLELLSTFIAEHYRFDSDVYPGLSDAGEEAKQAFALHHINLHLVKSAGMIAGACERYDHGESLDVAPLVDVARNLLMDSLRLSNMIGLSGNDLIEAIERKYGDKLPIETK